MNAHRILFHTKIWLYIGGKSIPQKFGKKILSICDINDKKIGLSQKSGRESNLKEWFHSYILIMKRLKY